VKIKYIQRFILCSLDLYLRLNMYKYSQSKHYFYVKFFIVRFDRVAPQNQQDSCRIRTPVLQASTPAETWGWLGRSVGSRWWSSAQRAREVKVRGALNHEDLGWLQCWQSDILETAEEVWWTLRCPHLSLVICHVRNIVKCATVISFIFVLDYFAHWFSLV